MRLESGRVRGFTTDTIAFACATQGVLANIALLPPWRAPVMTEGLPERQRGELITRLQSIAQMLAHFPNRTGLALQVGPKRQSISAQLASYGEFKVAGAWTRFALFCGVKTLPEASEQTLYFLFIYHNGQWEGYGQAQDAMTMIVVEPSDGEVPIETILLRAFPQISNFGNLHR